MASTFYVKPIYDELAEEEEQLMSDQNEYLTRTPIQAHKRSRVLLWALRIALAVSVAANLYLLIKVRASPPPSHQMFSPAIPAIAYEDVVTISGFGKQKSPYAGKPTPEKNELWRNLYNFGVSRIPMSDAARLPNRTVPIPNDPGYYAVTLEVFHELHCLNAIRQRLWQAEMPSEDASLMDMAHIDHCVDMLRQNVMCSSDITPFPWMWDPKAKKAMAVGKVIRTCRNFEKIRQWGVEHKVHEFDTSIFVEDPLGNMIIEEEEQGGIEGHEAHMRHQHNH